MSKKFFIFVLFVLIALGVFYFERNSLFVSQTSFEATDSDLDDELHSIDEMQNAVDNYNQKAVIASKEVISKKTQNDNEVLLMAVEKDQDEIDMLIQELDSDLGNVDKSKALSKKLNESDEYRQKILQKAKVEND